MVIVHAFLALLAGFATMGILATIISALIAQMAPDWAGADGRPNPVNAPEFAFISLGYSFLSAAAGGYVTAWLSTANPLPHVLMLGIVVLAMAALSALQSRGTKPVWYALMVLAFMPIGVLAGGLVRLRALGIL